MRKFIVGLGLVLSMATLGGCATGGGYPYGGYGNFGNSMSNHKNALAGAAIGGAGGALLGGLVSDSGNGALVGGAVGAAVGGLVGNSMDTKRRPQPYAYDGDRYNYGNYRRY